MGNVSFVAPVLEDMAIENDPLSPGPPGRMDHQPCFVEVEFLPSFALWLLKKELDEKYGKLDEEVADHR